MPNPQQPELARSRRNQATAEDAAATKHSKSLPFDGSNDPVGPVPPDNEAGNNKGRDQDKPAVPPKAYRVPDEAGRSPSVVDDAPASTKHPFRFDLLMAPLGLPFGVTSRTTWVKVSDEELEIRFGPWVLRTERSNVAGCTVTGPYAFLKVAGPPHLSVSDRGLTFATNRRLGACIRFHEPVPAALPGGLLRHPGVTVTVADPYALARTLDEDAEQA